MRRAGSTCSSRAGSGSRPRSSSGCISVDDAVTERNPSRRSVRQRRSTEHARPRAALTDLALTPRGHRLHRTHQQAIRSPCCLQQKGQRDMAKVVCVLYDDPVDGYPTTYPRDTLPRLAHYPGGQTLPTPSAVDFTPGSLLGSVSGELGLRSYLESLGHELIVTSDKEGKSSELDRHLADAEVVISQPFWPAYLTAERIARAPKLKLALTAGIGS